MFETLFITVLRSFAIPVVAIFLLKDSFLGESGSFLAVSIALTLVTVISVIWDLIKILPNAVLLRGKSIVKIVLKIGIEVVSVVGFWIYFLVSYG